MLYEESKQNNRKFRIYEMYNVESTPGMTNDAGVGDMLSNIGDTGEVRHSMWALMPDSVGDGDAINEDFISFVLNRDKYPTTDFPSAPYLNQKFHECLNNLRETLNKVDDKKKFYTNLLELQDYLIRRKLFNREPLDKEEMLLNEDTPKLNQQGLDREDADAIAKSFAEKMSLGTPQHLGGGGFGEAYLINNNNVLKLTTDPCEVDAAGKIHRAKPRTLVYVDKIYKVIETDLNILVYALIEDYIADKPVKEFYRLEDVLSKITYDFYNKYLRILLKGNGREEFKGKGLNDFPELAKLILTQNPDANVSAVDREKAYKYIMGLYDIKMDLMRLGIKSTDFMEAKNLGYSNDVLMFFDIGGCIAEEPNIPPENTITLPESVGLLDESLARETGDIIANKVAQQFQLGTPKYLKSGTFGSAYDIGDNKILKVTSDKSEAVENLKLIGKPLKYIAEPYKVYGITPRSGETKYFVIILEKLKTDEHHFTAMMERLDFAFNKILKIELGDVIDHYVLGYDTGVDEDKVKKYMSRNPKDKEFFDSLMKIAEECQEYGIESFEFLKPANLGYKKNGSLGFFDVGFGGFTVGDKKPVDVPMDVQEDGSAKFSTPDAIGQDGFPPYDNYDDSPLTDNNIPVNVMAEDLEYNHVVGDATDDEYMLSEVTVGGEYKAYHGSDTQINKFVDDFVGKEEATDQEGPGIYFSTNIEDARAYGKYIHSVILRPRKFVDESTHKNVNRKEITAFIKTAPDWEDTAQNWAENPENGLREAVNSLYEYAKNEKDLYQQIWYDWFRYHPLEYVRGMVKLGYDGEIINKAEGNKHFIVYNPDIIEIIKSEIINEERKKSYMPGSQSVEVKKKCKLGGLGNTSVACNQGDVNNLTFKSVKEEKNTIFAENKNMSENIMSLQDLPFKKEVESLGGKVFSVGGAVRDEFLGKDSKDLDVLVTGIPMDKLEAILAKYGRVSLEGKSFGVLKFKPKGATEDIDIAIPRTDAATGGGGHKDVDVTSDHSLPIEKDLERRDFTINAIAKDVEGNVVDPYGGQEDLKNKIIRAVNPEAFSDDPLRMLRAVQFASRFGFTIEPTTMQMIKDNASMIKNIPPERILTEFDKIVNKGDISIGAKLLKETGLFAQMFGDVETSMITKILGLIKNIISRFGTDPLKKAKSMGEFIYLLTKNITDSPADLFKNQLKGDIQTEKEIKAIDFANKNASNNAVKNRGVAYNMYAISPASLESDIIPKGVKVAAQELLQGTYPKSIGELQVNGNDLMQLGLKGKEIGDALKMMLLKIYADKVRNNKEELLSLLQTNSIQEGYPNYSDLEPQTWNVNGKEVGLDFFIGRYDEWNHQSEYVRYNDPSHESVLRFLEDEFEDLIGDDKLKRELYWKLTDREILNEDMKNVSYSAVVLDDKSRAKLLKVFTPMIPEGWEIKAHHMTIKMGALAENSKEKQDMKDGKEITLNVVDYAIDDKVMAVGVEGYQTANKKAHVTIAVNRQNGGKPFMSNNLVDWKPLGFPLSLTGIITEI